MNENYLTWQQETRTPSIELSLLQSIKLERYNLGELKYSTVGRHMYPVTFRWSAFYRIWGLSTITDKVNKIHCKWWTRQSSNNQQCMFSLSKKILEKASEMSIFKQPFACTINLCVFLVLLLLFKTVKKYEISLYRP